MRRVAADHSDGAPLGQTQGTRQRGVHDLAALWRMIQPSRRHCTFTMLSRAAALLASAWLVAGCAVQAPHSAATGVAAVPLLGRTPVDMAVSFVVGADCSIVRVDAGKAYCMKEPPPKPLPVCTRSLGTVDCWANPEVFGERLTEVADGPRALTPGQEQHRTRWGSGLW